MFLKSSYTRIACEQSREPGCSSSFPSAFLHVEISVKLLRVYIKWSLVLKHICAGGGNVTFVVYVQLAPNSDVSTAF